MASRKIRYQYIAIDGKGTQYLVAGDTMKELRQRAGKLKLLKRV